ncbi:hypothetical protein MTP99_001111 [Tenebrio molitor]|nr:hypothetical protein MTP99_001111 [Tenebrio molitor]
MGKTTSVPPQHNPQKRTPRGLPLERHALKNLKTSELCVAHSSTSVPTDGCSAPVIARDALASGAKKRMTTVDTTCLRHRS